MIDFDEDAYQDRKLNEYLDSCDYGVSNCCGKYQLEDTDICSECNEHSDEISTGDYNYMELEMAMCDKADSERELRREDG